MRLVLCLVLLAMVGCEEERLQPTWPTYKLSEEDRTIAISMGCWHGKQEVMPDPGRCLEDKTSCWEHKNDPHPWPPNVYASVMTWCRRYGYPWVFDMDNRDKNVTLLTHMACEKYLDLYFVVVKGYDTNHAQWTSTVLCERRMGRVDKEGAAGRRLPQ